MATYIAMSVRRVQPTNVDTLIARSLLMPSIATLLGRWFWWPQVVYPRGDNHFRRPSPPNEDTDKLAVPAQ